MDNSLDKNLAASTTEAVPFCKHPGTWVSEGTVRADTSANHLKPGSSAQKLCTTEERWEGRVKRNT